MNYKTDGKQKSCMKCKFSGLLIFEPKATVKEEGLASFFMLILGVKIMIIFVILQSLLETLELHWNLSAILDD